MLIQRNGDYVRFLVNGQVRGAMHRTCTMNITPNLQGIEVISKDSAKFTIYYKNVLQTQILPAAAVPFSGTLRDLWVLLVNGFFDELHSSAPAPPTEETYILTSGNYNIDLLYKNVINTANASNFRLPTIAPSLYGKAVTVFAGGFTVDVICDDPAGDRITDKLSVTLKKYDSATFICFSPNLWLIR